MDTSSSNLGCLKVNGSLALTTKVGAIFRKPRDGIQREIQREKDIAEENVEASLGRHVV